MSPNCDIVRASTPSEELDYDTPLWNLYLDHLIDRIRCLTMGIHQHEAQEEPLTKEEFEGLRQSLQDPATYMSHAELYSHTRRTRIDILSRDVLYELLDRLFNFQIEDEENLNLVSIHTLHTLRRASPVLFDIVDEWISDVGKRWNKFFDYELDFYQDRDHVRWGQDNPYNNPDLNKTSLPVQAVTTCAECFALMVEYSLTHADSYDLNGKSYLAWAIERNYQPSINWIIDHVPGYDEFWKADTDAGEKHALQLLIEAGNYEGL